MRARSLLSAWRRKRPPTRSEAADLEALLSGPLTLPRKGWRHALRHDPPRVVGLAIGYAVDRRLCGPDADVVFSAVLLRALAGDPAAALVLDHARRRRMPACPKGKASR